MAKGIASALLGEEFPIWPVCAFRNNDGAEAVIDLEVVDLSDPNFFNVVDTPLTLRPLIRSRRTWVRPQMQGSEMIRVISRVR